MDSGKVKYSSEKFALEDLQRIKEKRRKGEAYPIRAYLCKCCNCWHLSSKEQKASKSGNKKINLLKEQIEQKDICIEDLKNKIENFEQKLESKRKSILTLENEIYLLNTKNKYLVNQLLERDRNNDTDS